MVILSPGDSSGSNIVLLLAFLACLAGAGYFACAESGYTAVNKNRIKKLADDGDKRASRAMYITNNYERALTTILVGTNVLHVGCSSIATLLATRIWGAGAVASAIAVTTILDYFFSEMLPKSYANANSSKVALAFASSLRFLMKILAPVTFLFMGITKVVTRIFKPDEMPSVTEAELSTIIETAEEEKVIDEDKSDLLQSAMEFPTTTVKDVYTAREDIVAVECHMSQQEILALIRSAKHSRLPVYDRSLDHIVGVLSIRRYLKESLGSGNVSLREVMVKPYFVYPDQEIGKLLKSMTQNRVSLAIVRDRGGKTLGLITVEDFLEELVGEIFDEDDVVDENFMKLGGNRFSVSGTLSVKDAFARMGYKGSDPVILSRPVQAWAAECFGHEPEEEEEVDYERLTLTVTEMEDGHVKTLEIKINDEEPASPKDDGQSGTAGTEGKE